VAGQGPVPPTGAPNLTDQSVDPKWRHGGQRLDWLTTPGIYWEGGTQGLPARRRLGTQVLAHARILSYAASTSAHLSASWSTATNSFRRSHSLALSGKPR
jgi:hypothetical protein